MEASKNTILQITDSVSTRRCALRIDSEDLRLPLSKLLDRYLKRPALKRLLREKRVTEESAESLQSLQDLAYVTDDLGRLRDMFVGVAFRDGARSLPPDEAPPHGTVRLGGKEAKLVDLVMDRTNVGYDRNWVGFNKRRWTRHANAYSGFVRSCLEEEYGKPEAEAVLAMDSTAHKLRLVEALAKRIWNSDFENYSRFQGRGLVYKSGDETVRNIMEGSGGICSEKVQALKFLTDHYGLKSEFVLAGPDVPRPIPEPRLRELLTTFDFRFAKRHMRYWQHAALLYTIDHAAVLVDATNGNIPFLFLRDSAAHRLLGYESKPPVEVRMAVQVEEFYYHRVSQDIPENLFFAMEGWIPYVDLVQVFDNELGLCLSKDFMVTPIVFRNARTFDRMRQQYLTVCEQAGLRCSVSGTWDLESSLGQRFAEREPAAAEKVLTAEDRLLARYDECHGFTHEAGLVIIELDS